MKIFFFEENTEYDRGEGEYAVYAAYVRALINAS